jgi:hypothetical protein
MHAFHQRILNVLPTPPSQSSPEPAALQRQASPITPEELPPRNGVAGGSIH